MAQAAAAGATAPAPVSQPARNQLSPPSKPHAPPPAYAVSQSQFMSGSEAAGGNPMGFGFGLSSAGPLGSGLGGGLGGVGAAGGLTGGLSAGLLSADLIPDPAVQTGDDEEEGDCSQS